jgi:oligopeptide/dipeptide ABC transporter ATP-binding protein
MSAPLLEVGGLTTSFPGKHARLPIVDDVSFGIDKGEVLALVGESGCGKSMTALSIMRLVPKPGRIDAQSRILLNGKNLPSLAVPEMRRVRGGEIGMIFQEPMSSLNPVMKVGKQVAEAIRLHDREVGAGAMDLVGELFRRVGIPDPDRQLSAYPHQLSGGLKQRVMIAMAIAMKPKLLIADEPTTALDVTIQAQIISLMRELQDDLGTAILLITHDLGVVNELSDRVSVMYAGRIIETGPRAQILDRPAHPYTQGLLESMPRRGAHGERLREIEGVVPTPANWPGGCRFADRCSIVMEKCRDQAPAEVKVADKQFVRCHAVDQVTAT